jgi:hypothetical protein
VIDFDDMGDDPLAEQRAELTRIILQAHKWGAAARRLLWLGMAATLFGCALVIAGALGALAKCGGG